MLLELDFGWLTLEVLVKGTAVWTQVNYPGSCDLYPLYLAYSSAPLYNININIMCTFGTVIASTAQ